MFTAQTLIQSAQRLVRDKSEVLDNGFSDGSSGDWQQCLDNAIDFHSRYRKNILVVPVTATGNQIPTGDRVYPPPPGWQIGFSDAGFGIEYPVDPTREWPIMLRPTMFQPYDVPVDSTFTLGKAIRFRETYTMNGQSDSRPAKGDIFNVHFQVGWVVSDVLTGAGITTAYDSDFWPLVYLVASMACFMMASQLAQNMDASQAADSANYRDKDDKFTKLGIKYQAEYKTRILPPPEDVKAFGMLGEFEVDDYNRTYMSMFWRDTSNLLNSDR